ncbi:heme peroxidase, partial [Mycobacterium sp. ITM-2017-0098]
EDYINHITPIHFPLFVEPGIGTSERWYRQNWMSTEFNLLYRWPVPVLLPDTPRDSVVLPQEQCAQHHEAVVDVPAGDAQREE